MRRFTHLSILIAALGLAMAAVPSVAVADDPPPVDPTMNTSGGSTPPPSAADYDTWWDIIIPGLAATYPDATYEELCALALLYFNVYPPEPPG